MSHPEFGVGGVLFNGLQTDCSRPFALDCLKAWSRRSFSVGISTRRLKGVRQMHLERGNLVYGHV